MLLIEYFRGWLIKLSFSEEGFAGSQFVASTVEVVQRYKLKHFYENAEQKKTRAEGSLLIG